MRSGMRKAECNWCDDGMAHLRHGMLDYTLARFRDARRPDCMKRVRPGGRGATQEGRGECRVPVAPAAARVE